MNSSTPVKLLIWRKRLYFFVNSYRSILQPNLAGNKNIDNNIKTYHQIVKSIFKW